MDLIQSHNGLPMYGFWNPMLTCWIDFSAGRSRIQASFRLGCLWVVSLSWVACESNTSPKAEWNLPPLVVHSYSPNLILPNSTLKLFGSGFVPTALPGQVVRFTGDLNGQPATWTAVPQSDSPDEITIDLKDTFTWPEGATEWVATGQLTVTRAVPHPTSEDSIVLPVQFVLRNMLTGAIADVALTTDNSSDVWAGSVLTLTGDGFLLPGEGDTTVTFIETPSLQPGPHPVPTRVQSRNELVFEVSADPFGITPRDLIGTLVVQNHHSDGALTLSNPWPISWKLRPSRIDGTASGPVSRGQRIEFVGQGFLPADADSETATVFVLDGRFVPEIGDPEWWTAENSLVLFPSTISNGTSADYVLTVGLDVYGRLSGLGVSAGRFQGAATPYLFHGTHIEAGTATALQLTILPQLQVVWLKFLPGYYDALESFGLLAVEPQIRERIFAVCKRDYSNINIEFVDSKPENFAEYSIVEIGGRDPNGAFLFGLDNTQGKDTGNIRFNDIVGGLNAETEQDGYYGYGGVFVESFLALSPTLGFGSLPIQTHRFDDIFGPFFANGTGSPVSVDEVSVGPRTAAISEAIRVLGNLVGSTITHEVGHTLGLTNIADQFHNIGDNPGWIMDSGIFRPFEERAELDGQGPGIFSPFNREYLETILPLRP